jgi:hypothetical protein
MTFAMRIDPAVEFEQSVLARFNVSGWIAEPFGQALLPENARDALRHFEDLSGRPTLVRWMPDILAWRECNHRVTHLALIDAKVGQVSDNHAVEIAAADAMDVYVERLYIPAFFVFNDWTVLTPRDVKHRGRLGPDPRGGNGSGTPYYLVPKRFARAFDNVFPRDEGIV